MKKMRPKMFHDESPEEVFKTAKKISDLKNLGPATEKSFLQAGIKSAQTLRKIGWKKAMVKLVALNPKNRHSLFAYAIIGALKNQEWNAISESDKLEARSFCAKLKAAKPKKPLS
jgi:hypothetical protein